MLTDCLLLASVSVSLCLSLLLLLLSLTSPVIVVKVLMCTTGELSLICLTSHFSCS